MTTAIERAKGFSETKLGAIRERLRGLDGIPNSVAVVTCGSYARREASDSSDLDFFAIAPQVDLPSDSRVDPVGLPSWHDSIAEAIKQIVQIEPAQGGAFANVVCREEMLRNIGGDKDSNQKITQRMLLLLEGEWLANEEALKAVRLKILEHYIGEGMTDHQLALFLLNDIIRYYRTIAVDYEFKSFEGKNPKPWGIRNIKLVFSRKLLYASGLFSVAMTADRTRADKIKVLEELFELPVIDRVVKICGRSGSETVFRSYSRFLERLEDANVRERLKNLRKNERGDNLFRELKNEGHHFTRELLKLFEQTFDSTHPIRRAVIF
jgi:hypothetical protein